MNRYGDMIFLGVRYHPDAGYERAGTTRTFT